MRFQHYLLSVAVISAATQASAFTAGTVRRGQAEVAQGGVVIITPQAQQSVQPTTVVEAQPVIDSKADSLRRARQNAELSNEQKIVEKLEEDRLREEQQRLERLFGSRKDDATTVAPVVNDAQVIAPAAAATSSQQPAQVTIQVQPVIQQPVQTATAGSASAQIEKIEDVKAEAPVATPVVTEVAPIAAVETVEAGYQRRTYVGVQLALPGYSADNVKNNYGVGVTLGQTLSDNVSVDGSLIYTNYFVDTYWQSPLYREMEQYEIQVAGKYHFMSGPLRPFVGGTASYIYRQYEDRQKYGAAYYTFNPYKTSEDSHAFNLGFTGGADYAVTSNLALTVGFDWSFNLMRKTDMNLSAYGLPESAKPIEEVDFYTFKFGVKYTF